MPPHVREIVRTTHPGFDEDHDLGAAPQVEMLVPAMSLGHVLIELVELGAVGSGNPSTWA